MNGEPILQSGLIETSTLQTKKPALMNQGGQC
jgi:hypothetical protein